MFPITRLARHQNKPESALNDVLPRATKREREGQSCTDASTWERGLHNDPDTLSIVRNQLETLMGLVPIVTELKSACDAYNESAEAGNDPLHDAPYVQPLDPFPLEIMSNERSELAHN